MCRTTTFVVLAWVIGLAIPASADLVGYWKMDQGEGTAVWDYAEPYEDATISPENPAAVRWTTEGYKDGALEFLISTGPFTMVDAPIAGVNISEASYAFWMNMPKAFQAWGPIFVLLGGSIDHSIECDGAADLYISSGAVWFGTKGAALNDDQWHHVAVTYSTSGNQIAIYVDGKVAATSTSTLSDAIATVRIGGPRNRNQWRRFIGKLDDAAVWGNALSAEDVKNVFWVGPQWMRYATHPTPANEAIVDTANVTLAWTQGETASQHHVYVGEVREDVQNGTGGTDKGLTSAASFSNYPWALGKTYYWRVDEVEADGKTTYPGTVWTFTISAKLASNPAPTHGAVLVDPNVTLTWVAGSGAVSHDVYFGTDPANLAQVSKAQTGTVFTPVSVAYDTTYAWRVDEFDGTQTYTGDVWTFKTTPDIQVTDPNLVGFWDFNRDEDGIALDWSGHGQHGTLFGDPNRVAGYHQGAVAFDGMDDTVEVPQVISREAVSDMTLTAWIKADVPGAQGAGARQGSGLLWSDHAGGGDHFTVAVLGTKLAFETGPGGNPNTISNRDVVTGEWVHVAVTRAGSTSDCQVFIDGALDAASVHTGDTRVGSNPKIVIGGNPLDGRYFKGIIDEVRAYNRVLSQEELAVAMRANRLLAWDPRPVNGGVVDIRDPLMLTWSAGDGAVSHDVYFGTDPQAVGAADPAATDLYRGRLGATVYTPPDTLQWAQAYAWRVDEVAGDGTIVKGPVWSLSVADYFIVDDFEAYD
nr:LamG domain-containing protein [Phycisphaerae bacterium]